MSRPALIIMLALLAIIFVADVASFYIQWRMIGEQSTALRARSTQSGDKV